MNYRRVYIPNSFVHIIIASYERKHIFINNIDFLRTAFKNTMQYYKFEIVAICVLPEHIHLIINPENIKEYPKIISSIKHCFSHDVEQVCPTYLCTHDNLKIGYKNKREKGFFQRRFYEHTICSQDELNNHINYIHYNPVKHGYAKQVKDWEYSSFHKFVKNNMYDNNWGSSTDIDTIKDFNFE